MISLRLNGCTLLEKLPVDLGELSAIEELSMGECRNLRELPQGFGGLSSLHKLDLTGCISLQRLPESFGKLPIQSLNLQSLTNLDELPESTGNMPCLTHLKLISCNALTTLPNSFVQLSCLETLEIEDCNKLVALPRDFGQLSSLKEMTVRGCSKLEELPDGFQALPALMTFALIDCRCLLNLPAGFEELVCLEILCLTGLPISNLPDGFGKLKRLETLDLGYCQNLERLPDDFGSLASLTWLLLESCPNLDGREMEKIVKLKLCYLVRIPRCPKLIERWEEMWEEEEYPLLVMKDYWATEEELCRAAKVGLLGARCIQLDSDTQLLVERSTSILFEVETIVAVIALPVHVEDHHHWLTERLVGMAMEKAKTGSAGRLRIVYVKQVKRKGETTEKEEQEEKACFRHILMSAPKGSYAIPSNDSRCHRLLTFTLFRRRLFDAKKLVCRMLKMRVDYKGNKILELNDFIGEDDISGQSLHSSDVQDDIAGDEENENSNSIGEFIECICAGKLPGTAELSQSPLKESMFTEFLQILKENKADHLIDSKLNKVELDQLKGNVVGIFICDQNTPEYTKLQQIYKELRDKGLNFEVLWIPPEKFHGIGIYTRALQKMIWKALPNPNLVKLENTDPHFIIFDEEGSIGNLHALSPMMIWGAEAYPFSKSKINEIVSTIQSKFSLNFLFHKINLVNKEAIQNKLIFLYAEPPSQNFEMKSKLDQLAELHGNFEIIYVGCYFLEKDDISTFKEDYENVTQKIDWPKLSFEDMITFWYRCKYLYEEMKDQSNATIEELKILPRFLYFEKRWLVVLDVDGIVTRSGYEMVKMMCKKYDEKRGGVGAIVKNELLESLKTGKCNEIVKIFFKDTIINHPEHLHSLVRDCRQGALEYICDICGSSNVLRWDQQRRYRCHQCDWDLCPKCWKVFVKSQVQGLSLTIDKDK